MFKTKSPRNNFRGALVLSEEIFIGWEDEWKSIWTDVGKVGRKTFLLIQTVLTVFHNLLRKS